MTSKQPVSESEKAIRKVVNAVTRNLKSLEIYKVEYKPVIRRYAELSYFYDVQMQEFLNSDQETTVQHTNKAGATNEVKSPALATLERLRTDMLALENVLGLNPSAYARIKKTIATTKEIDKKVKELSKFEKVMAMMNEENARKVQS